MPLTAPHNHLTSARLKVLRSSLFISILSLLILTGYASGIFCDCHDGPQQEMTGHGKSAPATGDDCQCLCHQMVSDVSGLPVQLGAVLCVVLETVQHADQFPPDAVPLGIDHPPQIA